MYHHGKIDQARTNTMNSEEALERSINNIIEKLGPNKKLDLFECARYVSRSGFDEGRAHEQRFHLLESTPIHLLRRRLLS